MIKKRFCALLTIWPQDGDKRAAELLGELNKAANYPQSVFGAIERV